MNTEEKAEVRARAIDGFAFRLGCNSAKKAVSINGVKMISMEDLEAVVHKIIDEMKDS